MDIESDDGPDPLIYVASGKVLLQLQSKNATEWHGESHVSPCGKTIRIRFDANGDEEKLISTIALQTFDGKWDGFELLPDDFRCRRVRLLLMWRSFLKAGTIRDLHIPHWLQRERTLESPPKMQPPIPIRSRNGVVHRWKLHTRHRRHTIE